MSVPMKAIKDVTVTNAIVEEFITPLAEPRAGLALAADKQLEAGDWGDRNIEWTEVDDEDSVTLSMEIPPINASGAASKTRHTEESPIWTKDLQYGGRDWRSLMVSLRRRAQIAHETRITDESPLPDAEAMVIQRKAEAMAKEIDRQVLFGSGSDHPGSDNGVLNHTGVHTITDGGNWRDPDQMNSDVGSALATLADRGYSNTRWALLHNPADRDVFTELLGIGGGFQRAADVMGLDGDVGLTRRLESKHISAQRAYLVPDENHKNSWFWAHPEDAPEDGLSFGLGDVNPIRADNAPRADLQALQQAGTVQERRDDLFKTRTLRMLNIGTVVNIRTGSGDDGSGVAEIQFSK